MPQLLRGRQFKPHCQTILDLMVTVDVSQDICGFAPFCNDSDQRCANLHRASQRASWSTLKVWSIYQHHSCMLQTIAAVKFAHWEKIDDKKIHTRDRKSGSAFFTIKKNAFSLLIAYHVLPVQLFQVIRDSGLNYIALLAMNATKG